MEPQDLYGLPLDDFTNQRNALAKELRQEGRRDEAAAVAKLRKPSVAAWAVNQLVRTQQHDVESLLRAGDVLRQAQADLLAKRGDPAALRQAVEDERAAVARLLETARGLLDSDGHELTSPRLEQVTETLHAAALDEEARARVRDGCLNRELRHVGLGSLGTPSAAAPQRGRPRKPQRTIRAQQQPRRKARPQPTATQLKGRAARQERAAKEKAAREAEAAARRRLERASRQERTAERRRERAAAELSDADEELAAARGTTAEAESELRRAKQLLDQL